MKHQCERFPPLPLPVLSLPSSSPRSSSSSSSPPVSLLALLYSDHDHTATSDPSHALFMKARACLGVHPVEALFEARDETLASSRQVPATRLEAIPLGFHGVAERLLP